MPRLRKPANQLRYWNSSPEGIRLPFSSRRVAASGSQRLASEVANHRPVEADFCQPETCSGQTTTSAEELRSFLPR